MRRQVYPNCFSSAIEMTEEDKFQQGIELFNSRQFFLAHEVWEEIWMHESEPEKTFLQALIQLAAAFHHYVRGNSAGAQSLLAAAAVKLQRFASSDRRIDVAELRNQAIFWARVLGEGNDPGKDKLPRIGPG
jgi:predicted metal-dependent hydrolase